MKSVIEDIRLKIQNNYYVNEEHIRFNLVIRLLEKLGWDIWNPKEVYAELLVAPDEDKTKVDLALFTSTYSPSVFIEIKYLGKLFEKLSIIERQLRNYNRDNTATFSVITDGRIWRLYYSQTGGEFSQKCFKQIDLVADDIEDIELHFIGFLSKEEIKNGNAEREATKYLALTQKQKAMEDSILQARRMIQEPPYPSLPECLVNLVTERGIPLTIEDAIEYIKASPAKKLEPIEHSFSDRSSRPIEDTNSYMASEDLRFTRILRGKVADFDSNSWNELLRYALKLAIEKGLSLSDLNSLTNLNIEAGLNNKHGFRPIPGNKMSMQYVPATKAADNLIKVAKKLRLPLFVEFEWREKSPNAGKRGLIKENLI